MNRNPFTFLRIATCIALLALLGGRILVLGPTINLLLFLLLVIFWFVPTLLLNAAYTKTPRARMLINTLCAVLDAYVFLMATAEAAIDIWTNPFLLLGAYVFLASLVGGNLAGAGSAISGFCGLLNGWLTPLGQLQTPILLGGVGASVAGFVCGSAWHLILPMVIRAAQQQQAQASEPDATTLAKQTMLAGMDARLREITAERDQAQARLQQLEAQQAASAPPPAADTPPALEQPPKAKPSLPTGETVAPEVVLQQMEAELASLQTETTALTTEKQKLQNEVSRLSDALMSAFLPPPA